MPRATVVGTRPADTPGPAMIHGTRSVASYTKSPWVPSPCSPRLSPWSAVASTRVRASVPFPSSTPRSRASCASTNAISPSYGAARNRSASAAGGSYGACGS